MGKMCSIPTSKLTSQNMSLDVYIDIEYKSVLPDSAHEWSSHKLEMKENFSFPELCF